MPSLVTGGAGYIGSHMAHLLVEHGDQVTVLDNLSSGVQSLIPPKARFVLGDISDRHLLRRILAEQHIDTVFHFAASTIVEESVHDPLLYYANNTAGSRDLIQACVQGGISYLVFSSTAAVYGSCDSVLISEEAATAPVSPYGRSKLMTEWILDDAARASGLRYIALRYFNVAGADPFGRTGQSTPKATHLIKSACQAALGRRAHLNIFGVDYDTPDGTGVRDYIHVSDLVAAHALALDHLRAGGPCGAFNCGYGRGFSVREVIKAVERVSGRTLLVRECPRRAGDAPAVIADSSRLKKQFGWTPRYDALDQIVEHALAWESSLCPA
jgi:UDP-glucose 4-epimerase